MNPVTPRRSSGHPPPTPPCRAYRPPPPPKPPKRRPAPVSPFAVPSPRVVMEFPAAANDILLSGLLSGGQVLAKKPLLVDVSLGRGHMVLYALRPFWRWQTQGSYRLGFNALLNWNHLDAGAARQNATATGGGE